MPIGLVTTRFTGTQVRGGGINVLAFDGASHTAQNMIDATRTFWVSVLAASSNDLTAQVDNDVTNIEPSDGSLLGLSTGSGGAPIVGSETGDNLPPATQGLVRALTGGVRNNRLIRGRIFCPGMVEAHNTPAGQPDSTLITALQNAVNALIAASVPWVIYSRPSPGQSDGQAPPVLAGSVWAEWAGLRSRRD